MQAKKKTLEQLETELQQHERNIIEYEKKKIAVRKPNQNHSAPSQ